MVKYFFNKLLSMIIVLTVVSTITFFVSRLLPGDPISLWVGDHPTKEQLKLQKKILVSIGQSMSNTSLSWLVC